MTATIPSIDYPARLRAAGLRVTRPRLAILGNLEARSVPATIEEVHESLGSTDCDLVTVYRCMDTFEEIGLVQRFYGKNGTSAFLLVGQNAPLFVASERGFKAVGVSGKAAAELLQSVATVAEHLRKLGYQDVTTLVEFFGEPGKK